MPDDIRDILVEIIDSYGIKILEDPDRLAQFLEDRSSLRPEDTFHLTFALRFLLKCGWRPSRREYMKEGADYRASLESQLGFTKEQAAEVMKRRARSSPSPEISRKSRAAWRTGRARCASAKNRSITELY